MAQAKIHFLIQETTGSGQHSTARFIAVEETVDMVKCPRKLLEV